MDSSLQPTLRLRRIIISFFIILCTVLISVSLYTPELVGVSDNGDFNRIMRPNRVTYIEGQREPFVFESQYRVTYKGDSYAEKIYNLLFTLEQPYFTTQNLFVKSSLLLNLISNVLTGTELWKYNIFWLGIVYFVFALGAFATIFSQFKTDKLSLDSLFYLFFTIMFTDIAYTAYFNSFFGEPVQFVALLWITASLIGVIRSQKHKIPFVILFFISVIVYSGAKFANIPQGVLLALCGLSFLLYFKGKKVKQGITVGLLLATLIFCFISYQKIPRWMDNHTTYQPVFFGILKGSPSPEDDLTQLGLSTDLSVLANTNAYMTGHKIDINTPEFQTQFYDKISKVDVLKFYLKNPSRLVNKIEISCLDSAHIRPIYLSNYENTHERLKFKNEVGIWSNLRLMLPFDSLPFTVLLFLVSGGIVLYEIIKIVKRKSYETNLVIILVFFIVLLAINLMNLVIPVIANGEADLAKHMFAYIMGLDLQVLFLIFWLLHKAVSKGIDYKKLAGGIALVLVSFSLFGLAAKSLSGEDAEYRTGTYVYLGQQQGQPIRWLVIHSEGTRLQLFAEQPVKYASYNDPAGEGDANRIKYGSNLWEDSKIRDWLNNDFITCFSPSELELIQENQHWVILSVADKDKAERGNSELFWTHLPTLASYGAESAYAMSLVDRVFLLNINDYSKYSTTSKLRPLPGQSYWLETPYYNNSSMVRVIAEDGYVYMKDASYTDIGIRPCVIIDTMGTEMSGTGKHNNPYIFTKP